MNPPMMSTKQLNWLSQKDSDDLVVYYWIARPDNIAIGDWVLAWKPKYSDDAETTLDIIRSQAFIAVTSDRLREDAFPRPNKEMIDKVKREHGYVNSSGCPRY